ncbi:unnamed protein product, partial [Rotaria sordida]
KKNHFGRTPIHTAALFGSAKVLHYLLAFNIIDIDQPDTTNTYSSIRQF